MKNFETLEVGKTYKNRCGTLVKIDRFDPRQSQPFYSECGVTFYSNGSYLPSKHECMADLVELFEDVDALLKAYATEMGLFGALTIKSLIDSHRTLRQRSLRNSDELSKEMEKYREIGREYGRKEVTNGEYIELEKLKSMTLQELAEFVSL